MKTEIKYYDPKSRQTLTRTFDLDWQAEAFVNKIFSEGKFVRGVRKIPVEKKEDENAADKKPPV